MIMLKTANHPKCCTRSTRALYYIIGIATSIFYVAITTGIVHTSSSCAAFTVITIKGHNSNSHSHSHSHSLTTKHNHEFRKDVFICHSNNINANDNDNNDHDKKQNDHDNKINSNHQISSLSSSLSASTASTASTSSLFQDDECFDLCQVEEIEEIEKVDEGVEVINNKQIGTNEHHKEQGQVVLDGSISTSKSTSTSTSTSKSKHQTKEKDKKVQPERVHASKGEKNDHEQKRERERDREPTKQVWQNLELNWSIHKNNDDCDIEDITTCSEPCRDCRGEGKRLCQFCHGIGYVDFGFAEKGTMGERLLANKEETKSSSSSLTNPNGRLGTECPVCNEDGEQSCSTCRGSGWIANWRLKGDDDDHNNMNNNSNVRP